MAEALTLTARSLAGEDVWGPEKVPSDALGAELQRRVAAALQRAPAAVKLVLPASGIPDDSLDSPDGPGALSGAGRVLDPGLSLAAEGLADGAVLTAVVCDVRQQAQELLERLGALGATKDTEDSETLLAFKRSEPGLSEEVRAWCDVFALNGKLPDAFYKDFAIFPERLWVKDSLFYLSRFGHNSNVICVFVDCDGRLGELQGRDRQEAAGGVWYADVLFMDDDTEDEGADDEEKEKEGKDTIWTPSFWGGILRDLGGEPRGRSGSAKVAQAPVRVASGLTDFFRQWAEQGRLPSAHFRYEEQ